MKDWNFWLNVACDVSFMLFAMSYLVQSKRERELNEHLKRLCESSVDITLRMIELNCKQESELKALRAEMAAKTSPQDTGR